MKIWIGIFIFMFLPACKSPNKLRPLPRPVVLKLESNGIDPGELFRHQQASFHWVHVSELLKPHYHAKHDEVVIVVAGKGVMVIAQEEYEVGPGTLIRIPKGYVHSFRPKGLVKALSVISPPFDGKDRIFIDL